MFKDDRLKKIFYGLFTAIGSLLIAVVAVMLWQMVPIYKSARKDLAYGLMVPIWQGIKAYQNDCHRLPSSLEDLPKTFPGCANTGESPYIKSIPKDPSDGSYIYEMNGSHFFLSTSDGKIRLDENSFKENRESSKK